MFGWIELSLIFFGSPGQVLSNNKSLSSISRSFQEQKVHHFKDHVIFFGGEGIKRLDDG